MQTNWKRTIAKAFVGMVMMISIIPSKVICATEDVGVLPQADLSKGITYGYVTSGGVQIPSYIHLNGNSVIIQESANSTAEKPLNNMIIDSNRNGVVDDGEQMAMLDGSVDVPASCPIYGVYKESTTEPMVITINSGTIPTMYGLYYAESNVKDTTAVKITANDANISSALFPVYFSKVVASGATAVDFTINGGTIGKSAAIVAAMSSEISSTNGKAIINRINVNDWPSTFFVAQNTNIVTDGEIAVDAVIDIASETKINNQFFLYNSNIEVKNAKDTAVSLSINNGIAGYFSALYNTKVNLKNCTGKAVMTKLQDCRFDVAQVIFQSDIQSDGMDAALVDMDVIDGSYSQFTGVVCSVLNAGKTTGLSLDMDITGKPAFTSCLMMIDGGTVSSSGTTYEITGDIQIDVDADEKSETGDKINNIRVINNNYIVNGDVAVHYNNVFVMGSYGLNYTLVNGDFTYIYEDTCELFGSNYAAYYSSVTGNADVRMLGNSTRSSANVYGFYYLYNNQSTVIGGTYDFSYDGGYANSLQVVYGKSGAQKDSAIKGDVIATIKNGEVSSFYGLQYVYVDGKVSLNADGTKITSYILPVSSCIVDGDVDVKVLNNPNAISNYTNIRMVENVTIDGNVNVTLQNGCSSYLYGIYGGSITGNAVVNVSDINNDDSSKPNYTVYMTNGGEVKGNLTVNVSDSRFGTVYGCNGTACAKNVVSNIENVETTSDIYGANPGNVDGNVTVTLTDVKGYNVRGFQQNGNVKGNVDVTITRAVDTYKLSGAYGAYSYTVNGNVTVLMKDCDKIASLYAMDSMKAMGDVKLTIDGGNYTGSYSYFYGMNSSNAQGNIQIDFKNCDMEGTVYPINTTTFLGNEEAIVNFSNVRVTYPGSGMGIIGNNLPSGQNVTMYMDEECEIGDNVSLRPSASSNSTGTLTYKGELYLGGEWKYDENTEYDVVHFTTGQFYIPKNVVVKANTIYLENPTVVVEGTLDCSFAGTTNTEGKYSDANFYINGGTLTKNRDKIARAHYPYVLEYDDKSCVVTNVSGSLTGNAFCPDVRFLQVGNKISYTVKPNAGYHIGSVFVETEDSENPTNIELVDGTYTYVMGNSSAVVKVECPGDTISVAKTIADPVAKLNQKYTVENPLYDLSTIYVRNDAPVGTVSYEVDEAKGLPEGLSIEDNKICGTPTKAYEDGKNTIIYVIGKNGNRQFITLNVVVTEGESVQTNQEGRITVDEENSVLHLNGNSVVFEAKDSNTAIYIDDNRDGIADLDKPVYVGDLTKYTVYGAKDASANSPIRITMNSGTIGTLYGCENTTLPAKDNVLYLDIKGGTIGKINCFVGSSTEGTLHLSLSPNAQISTVVSVSGNYTCKGYLYNNKGVYYVNGEYTLHEELTVEKAYVVGKLIIAEDGAFSVTGTLYRQSNSYTIVEGSLDVKTMNTSSSYNGFILVKDGGVIPKDNTWKNVYYPVTVSSGLKNTNVTINSRYLSLKEGDTTNYYLNADGSGSSQIKVTAAEGYSAFYSVDGGENVPIENYQFYYPMPPKHVTISITYVPNPIAIEKQFADPVAIVGQTYTSESPLYDLKTLVITGDTSSMYGGTVAYALKNEDALPDGLQFENGQIIGKPTKVDEDGTKLTFGIVGKNGYETELDVLIKVASESYKNDDINNSVKISGNTINLNGTSIVILPNVNSNSNASIYPDRNHDKNADNNIPLRINDQMSYDLANYTISGYTDTTKAYEGDISITMKGGNVKMIRGACGSSTSKKAVVNGDVIVNIEGGTIKNNSSNVYGLYYAEAHNVTFNLTGGIHQYADFIAAYYSVANNDINYTVGGNLDISGSSSSSYQANVYVAQNSEVKGDVNMELGSNVDVFSSNYTYFYGLVDSTVQGNVNGKYVGLWAPQYNYILRNTVVNKDFEMEWEKGTVYTTHYAYKSKIAGIFKLTTPKDAEIYSNENHLLNDSTAKSLYVDIGGGVNVQINSVSPLEGTSSVKETVFVKRGAAYTLGGKYTIEDDLTATNFKLMDNAEVTIAENVTVEIKSTVSEGFYIPETAKLINNGTMNLMETTQKSIYGYLENNGEMTSSDYLYVNGTLKNSGTFTSAQIQVQTTGIVVNDENATWNVNGRLINNNKIINYGTFNQTFKNTYYNRLGLIYTTKPLQLAQDVSKYSSSYNSFYYACEVVYPKSCVENVTVTGEKVMQSGLEGDERQYVLADSQFAIELGTPVIEGIKPIGVTYGSADNAMIEQANGTWAGTATHEPMVISVNYDEQYVSRIELSKTSDRIENTEEYTPLIYNKEYKESNPLYDLRAIEILNDMEEGEVVYAVDNSSALPEGLKLVNGRLCGTLKRACETEQQIVFVIQGKNNTSAFFTLTLGEIKKAVPSFTPATGLKTNVDTTLADVTIKNPTTGVYHWKDETISVGDKATVLEDVEIQFTPNDTVNYDWEAVAAKIGATYQDGVLTCKVNVEVCKIRPPYTTPIGLTATYGQMLSEIEIPVGDNAGTFEWKNPSDTVGNVGSSRNHYAIFTPDNTDKYEIIQVLIPIRVSIAIPEFEPALTEVKQDCGSTLESIILPTAENGTYQWITDSSIIPSDGVQYQVGFKPKDTSNYDWTKVPGWNSSWGCVVFPVTVYVEHIYEEDWVYDEESHWYNCIDPECTIQNELDEHQWVAGEILEKPSTKAPGSQKYSCFCGATKTVELPMIEHNEHTYSDQWLYDDTTHWQVCTLEECGESTTLENHAWDYSQIIEDATETSTGLVKRICKCGITMTEELPVVPHTDHKYENGWLRNDVAHWRECTFEGCGYVTDKIAHVWNSSKIIINATETSEGVMEYACHCGATKRESIPKLEHINHRYSNLWKYDEIYHWHECTDEDCDSKSSYATHTWDEGVIETEPTETENGIKKYTCECGASKTETIPALAHTNHTYGAEWIYDETAHWKECTFEGCDNVTDKIVHIWTSGQVIKNPTETAEGIIEYYCVCGSTKQEAIPKLNHKNHKYSDIWAYDEIYHWHECTFEDCEETTKAEAHIWDAGEVIKEASETEEGAKKYTCKCGASKTEIIPILEHTNHTYGEEWKQDETAHWKECTFEGCEETTEAEAHVWDAGEVTKEASETEEGIKNYTCECGASKTETIPMLEHTNHTYGVEWKQDETAHWKECTFEGCEETTEAEAHVWDAGEVIKEASEMEAGIKKYTCTVCGFSYTQSYELDVEEPDTSPDEEKPSTSPDEEKPGTSPDEEKPGTSPDEEKPGASPDEEKPGTSPDEEKPGTSPDEEKPGTLPDEEKPSTSPDEEKPGTSPDEEKPSTSPDAEKPSTSPDDEEPSTSPDDEEPDTSLDVDEEFVDEKTQITYVVSVKDKEVELVELGKKSAKEVTIPGTITYEGVTYKVTSIANEAFKNYKFLKKITIGSNIKIIGNKAFYGCKKLTTVKMGKNVEIIGNSAFQNCTALKKIEIPSKVKKIGSKAFYGCKNLTSITIKTTKLNTKNVGKNAFKKAGSKNYKKLVVKVPKSKYKSYKTTLKKRGLSTKAKIKK